MKRWEAYFVFLRLCFFPAFIFALARSQVTHLSPSRTFHSVPILKQKRVRIKMDLNALPYLFCSHNVWSFLIRCSHFWCDTQRERSDWKWFTKHSGYFKDLEKTYMNKEQIQKEQILHDCRMHFLLENHSDKAETIITLIPCIQGMIFCFNQTVSKR